ncbi:MAG: 4a-hydroxytetrahydrobiopterin dehydratase [Rhodobacter sp.]|nr:4a-hydroxytetrahydrobiopterin dehydratase [Paracoccaceae bacterium]MCB1410633.1 4a-hydroxytetrahydrobiopterin dehydratase [Paracoccaceae bacterium]MCC0081341.1 4a-hydroxytetrahydrobiopterin dehydratase [Rhodobacter sp.]
MTRPALLDGEARDRALSELAAMGWTHDPVRDAVSRHFRFRDFSDAFGWMTRVALEAEKLDHHPEWFNVWNRVDAVLTTHDVAGLTDLDLKLARAMTRLAGQVVPPAP